MVSEGRPEAVQLPVRWVGVEETPLLVANQFLGQVGLAEVILNVGAAVPPPILPGPPEQQAEQLAEYSHVTIRTVARLGLNRTSLEQLIEILQQTLVNYDQVQQQVQQQITEEAER